MSQGVLYVGGIPGHLSDEYILSYFKQYSPQAKLKVVRYPTRSPKCDIFGFLTIPVDIMPLIQNQEHILANKKLIFEEHLSDEKSILIKNSLKRRRLFVRGIKKGITDQDLFEAFSCVGDLESAYIIKDQLNNKSRSFGYVTFRDESVAFELADAGTFMCKGIKLFVHPFLKNSNMISSKPDQHLPNFQTDLAGNVSDPTSGGSFRFPSKMAPGSISQNLASEKSFHYQKLLEDEVNASSHHYSPQQDQGCVSPAGETMTGAFKKSFSPHQMNSQALYQASVEYNHMRQVPSQKYGNPLGLSSTSNNIRQGRVLFKQNQSSTSKRVSTKDQFTDESDNRSSILFTTDSRATFEESSEYVYRFGSVNPHFSGVPKPTQRSYFGKLETKLLHEEINLRFNHNCGKVSSLRH